MDDVHAVTSCCNGNVNVNSLDGSLIRSLTEATQPIRSIDGDSTRLLVGSYDGILRLYTFEDS